MHALNDLPERVAARFAQAFSLQPNGCWLWGGRRNRSGIYGALYFNHAGQQRGIAAHRLSWVLNRGPIPDGLHVLHRCDVPLCVNPEHLFLGTHAENMADKVGKGRHRFGVRLGAEGSNAKLTDKAVADIRQLIGERVPRRRIAERFGVCKSTINWIAKGRTWANGSKVEVRDAGG